VIQIARKQRFVVPEHLRLLGRDYDADDWIVGLFFALVNEQAAGNSEFHIFRLYVWTENYVLNYLYCLPHGLPLSCTPSALTIALFMCFCLQDYQRPQFC
jgi:hypothetical protein